ncbi:hypothetical protein [Butyrivibrio sp. YAB3001]|uniref:hypothetical protein n=1 Tax=Butyrivibrio sp. YAB3001 TaxID=1520812 RepID=UPI0008F67EB5|nr:hypothetical protein [Butyrivibrio sp. YAB3001]SFC50132.1 hypothetical protein SAMN02910398_02421 [Butyrivibrio sp. YAB3001]
MFETGHGEACSVNGVSYKIKKLLGKGKGGYSYLAVKDGKEYVLKQIHHEPCAYYQFGDKIQSEINDYRRLTAIGIRMPKMIDYECNDYMEEWDFENWEIKYWSKTPEFLEYYKEHM